jgi:thiopurine S-methyltransferase
VEYGFWAERWDEGRIGFHRETTNPALEKHTHLLQQGENTRILVPLCGKTRDMTHLAHAGFDVVGAEFVEKAAQDFFDEQNLAYGITQEFGHPIYSNPDFRIHVVNIFQLPPEAVGKVDAVYDRAAMIALPPQSRAPYAAHIGSLMAPGAKMLLLSFEYDQSKLDGPPFSVSEEEILSHYSDGFTVEKIFENLDIDVPPRFSDLGLQVAEKLWLITKAG